RAAAGMVAELYREGREARLVGADQGQRYRAVGVGQGERPAGVAVGQEPDRVDRAVNAGLAHAGELALPGQMIVNSCSGLDGLIPEGALALAGQDVERDP